MKIILVVLLALFVIASSKESKVKKKHHDLSSEKAAPHNGAKNFHKAAKSQTKSHEREKSAQIKHGVGHKKEHGHGKRMLGNQVVYTDCERDCTNSPQRTCYYEFTLENYHVMGPACGNCSYNNMNNLSDCFKTQCVTADGVERCIKSINRQLPGPPIHVCHNDMVVVDCYNRMSGAGEGLHWHGVKQKKTPYMDGVPFVTQCPINAGTDFRYKFQATEPGTLFYHSHSGHNKADGIFGAFIVHESKDKDKQGKLFDNDLPEHTIVINDWMHMTSEDNVPGVRAKPEGIQTTSVLVNGRGTYLDPKTNIRTKTPYATFYVKSQQSYRFRMINSAALVCPFLIQIQNHPLTLIASDGLNLKPTVFNTLVTLNGERYDFVLNATQKSGNYWIRITGLGFCAADMVEQYAVLVYDKSPQLGLVPSSPVPKYSEPYPTGIIVNHPNTTCGADPKRKCITDLQSLNSNSQLLKGEPDYKFYFSIGSRTMDINTFFRGKNYQHFDEPQGDSIHVGQMNNRSFVAPHSPLLTQPEDAFEAGTIVYYPSLPRGCNATEVCDCSQVVKVKTNSIVEIIIVDEQNEDHNVNHPMHIHGHNFVVTAMEQFKKTSYFASQIAVQDKKTPIKRIQAFGPEKDTVSVPPGGYVIFRFLADNPGYWLFHCHIEWHMHVGMAMIVQVGEQNEMVKAPRDFPTCKDYRPAI